MPKAKIPPGGSNDAAGGLHVVDLNRVFRCLLKDASHRAADEQHGSGARVMQQGEMDFFFDERDIRHRACEQEQPVGEEVELAGLSGDRDVLIHRVFHRDELMPVPLPARGEELQPLYRPAPECEKRREAERPNDKLTGEEGYRKNRRRQQEPGGEVENDGECGYGQMVEVTAVRNRTATPCRETVWPPSTIAADSCRDRNHSTAD